MTSSRRLLRSGAAPALVAAEAVAVVALYRLGRSAGFALPAHDLGRWLRTAPTEVLVAASSRLAGLALASWLLATTVVSATARLVPAWRTVRAFDLATPAAVRRFLDRTLVVGLGASLAIGGVRPASATSRSSVAVVARSVVATTSPDRPVPRVPPAPRTPTPPRRTAAPRASPPVASGTRAGSVVVRPGDNLWLIAQRAVGSDRPALVAPYWRAVVAANAPRLRSHDPNLIYPGERVVLPTRLPPRTAEPPG